MSDTNDTIDDDGEDTIGALDVTNKSMEAVMKGFMTKLDGFTKGLQQIQAVGTRGRDGGFSGQLVDIGKTQVQLQRTMAERLAQIQIAMSSKGQLNLMKKAQESMDFTKTIDKMFKGGSPAFPNGGSKGNNQDGIWNAMKGLFSGFKGMFGSMFKGLSKIWAKTGGALFKKTGSMGINKLLGLGGVGVIGALVGKMISSSPLLQAMFKILNTSLTLILRPIGDFVGSFLRPISMYFLKEVAIPAFKKGQGLMNIGEKWGKIAVGFFVSPSKAIQSGITLALAGMGSVAKALFGVKDSDIKEAEMYQKDPAKYKRYMDLKKESDINRKPISQAGMFGILGITGQGTTANYGEFGTDPNFMGGMEWFEDWEETIDTATTATGEFAEHTEVAGESVINAGEAYADAADEIEKTTTVIIDTGKVITTGILEFDETLDKGTTDTKETFIDLNAAITAGVGGLGYNLDNFNKKIDEGGTTWFDTIATTVTDGAKWISDGFLGMVNSIDLSKIGLQVAFGQVEDEIETSGGKLSAMANIATGGMFGVDKAGKNLSYADAQKNILPNMMDPKDSLLNKGIMASGLSLEEFQKAAEKEAASTLYGTNFSVSNPVVSPDAPLSSMDKGMVQTTGGTGLAGHVGKLGANMSADSMKFESSPGVFVNISKDVAGVKTPISPQSPEGQTIQAIYNQQLKNKIANAAQTEHVGKVGDFTTAAEGQAYVLAGGGQAGLEAAAIAKAEGLNLHTSGDIAALNEAMGGVMDHTMVKKAEADVANAEAAGITVLPGTSISESAAIAGYAQNQGGFVNVMSNSFTAGLGDSGAPASLASVLKGGITSIASSFSRGPSASNTGTGGGAGAARGNRGGTKSGASGAAKSGGGNSSKGGAGTSRGNRGGSKSGASGASKSGGGKGSKGGAGKSRGSRGKGSGGSSSGQWGAIIDEPIIGLGLHSGDEWRLGESQNELVTPMSEVGDGGSEYNINIHIGNISKEADYTKLKPLIQRWILEASSRRGVV